jgi:hypothetical protein
MGNLSFFSYFSLLYFTLSLCAYFLFAKISSLAAIFVPSSHHSFRLLIIVAKQINYEYFFLTLFHHVLVSSGSCFCDRGCLDLGDCCSDFKHYCGGTSPNLLA